MKILVTGGAGFIGSHIVDAYVAEGHDVVVFDNLATGNVANVNPQARLVVGDITTEALDTLMDSEQFDVVNHHAAHMELRVSLIKPLYDASTNILGSIRVLEAARRTKVKHTILASSLAVIGNLEVFPANEAHPTQPISPYGISKQSMEQYARLYRNTHKMSITCFRYTTVFGPRQNPHGESGVVAIFLQKFLNGAKATIHGDGNQTRDYIYIDDIVTANTIALQQQPNDTFFISTETEVSVNDIVSMLQEDLSVECVAVNGPEMPGDPRRTICSSARFTAITGWTPQTSVREGVAATAAWFSNQMLEG